MAIVVPNAFEVLVLNWALKTEILSLRLFSNNYTPVEGSTLASFTEVTGGGYLAKLLTPANWTVTAGDPSFGLYDAQQTFSFTGPTGAPSTIYGYYMVDTSNVVRWAERFPGANLPFTPVAGSSIRITPRFEAA
jgi:hypothetical protein